MRDTFQLANGEQVTFLPYRDPHDKLIGYEMVISFPDASMEIKTDDDHIYQPDQFEQAVADYAKDQNTQVL